VARLPRHRDCRSWRAPGPDILFPADRSWLLSRLWDDDWRCIGGPSELIDRLVSNGQLEARRVSLTEDATRRGISHTDDHATQTEPNDADYFQSVVRLPPSQGPTWRDVMARIAQTQVGPVSACPDQLLERLGLVQPAGGARCLNLPVQPGNLAQWVSRLIRASTTAGSTWPWRTHHRRNVHARDSRLRTVVGPERAAPGQDGRLGQLSRMVYAGVVEEV
jgi:hypothetical protein